jgi:hypothetical protein
VATSRRASMYVLGVVLSAALVCVVAGVEQPVVDPRATIILVALTLIGAQMKVQRVAPTVDISFNFIIQLAAIALVGALGAVIVAGLPWLLERRSRQIEVRLFNTAMTMVTVAGGSLAFTALSGRLTSGLPGDPGPLLLHLAVPLMAANVVMFVLNAMVLAGVIALDERVPYREVASGILRSGGTSYLGYGVFGLLLVVLWDAAGVGPLSAVLVLAPLTVARWAFAQYADQHAAHERTVAALVQAVEAKDHYTRGHSERVARASVLIGRTVSLSSQRTSVLHFAGMLHDVGKLGVPTRVLQKTGALTDEEFATIARHPVRGLEMVREIEFLGEAFEGILHHHERLDGRGYPMGLAGEAIPEFARIIAVADAFDSMTSTRSYRQARSVDEAVHELQRCSGTQFDPRFVEALTDALDRTTWEPAEGTDDGPPLVASVLATRDHDDPDFDPHGLAPSGPGVDDDAPGLDRQASA